MKSKVQSFTVLATAPGTVAAMVSLPKDISAIEAKKLLQHALTRFVYFQEHCTQDESNADILDKEDILGVVKTDDLSSLIEKVSTKFGMQTNSVVWAQRFFEGYCKQEEVVIELLNYIRDNIYINSDIQKHLERSNIAWLAGLAGVK